MPVLYTSVFYFAKFQYCFL